MDKSTDARDISLLATFNPTSPHRLNSVISKDQPLVQKYINISRKLIRSLIRTFTNLHETRNNGTPGSSMDGSGQATLTAERMGFRQCTTQQVVCSKAAKVHWIINAVQSKVGSSLI
jgi:hypothetical protein